MLSKNAIGIIALVFTLFNLDVPEAAIAGAWDGIGAVLSLILLVINQINRSDTSWFIFKK